MKKFDYQTINEIGNAIVVIGALILWLVMVLVLFSSCGAQSDKVSELASSLLPEYEYTCFPSIVRSITYEEALQDPWYKLSYSEPWWRQLAGVSQDIGYLPPVKVMAVNSHDAYQKVEAMLVKQYPQLHYKFGYATPYYYAAEEPPITIALNIPLCTRPDFKNHLEAYEECGVRYLHEDDLSWVSNGGTDCIATEMNGYSELWKQYYESISAGFICGYDNKHNIQCRSNDLVFGDLKVALVQEKEKVVGLETQQEKTAGIDRADTEGPSLKTPEEKPVDLENTENPSTSFFGLLPWVIVALFSLYILR